jgi:hypothetical protein
MDGVMEEEGRDAVEAGDGVATKLGLALMSGSGRGWNPHWKSIQSQSLFPITIS